MLLDDAKHIAGHEFERLDTIAECLLQAGEQFDGTTGGRDAHQGGRALSRIGKQAQRCCRDNPQRALAANE